jgi:hypothetical protein
MAVYAYIYANYPSTRESKFYVCDYGRGRAHTYQVVPQLQREFDRKAYENKTRINKKRFRKLRKKGALFTSNTKEKRAPLYGEIDGEVPEAWSRLAGWLSGRWWPGEVDWEGLGAELRANLEAGRRLPDPLRGLAEQVETGRGESWDTLWERLRERQREAGWIHGWRSGREEASAAPEDSDGPLRLYEAVRERGAAGEPVDEKELVARLAEPLVEGGATDWASVTEALPDREAWYETVPAGDGPMRVPVESLYDTQWRIAETLRGARMHHACATHLHEPASRGLHARYHAGARRAVCLEIAEFPTCVTGDAIWRELSFATDGGKLAGWSDEGLEVLTDLLVDPKTGRLAAGSPASDVLAELVAWPVDEAIRRRLDEEFDDGARWRYSRHGGQIAISTATESASEMPARLRTLVGEALDSQEWSIDASAGATWRAGDGPLVVGDLAVPEEVGGPVGLTGGEARRAQQAMSAAEEEGELDEAERATLASAHALTGRLAYGLAADPEWRQDVERLAESLALEAFAETCIAAICSIPSESD